MGAGSFCPNKYFQTASQIRKIQSMGQEALSQTSIHPTLEIRDKIRESCVSQQRYPLSIVIGFDVTGSMGKIPEQLISGPLGSIFDKLSQNLGSKVNPQVMFAAFGDSSPRNHGRRFFWPTDDYPLQVGQFESDNRSIENLRNIYKEAGGGEYGKESPNLLWYYLAYRTKLESIQTKQRGIVFTIGDEGTHEKLTRQEIIRFVDSTYNGGDLSTKDILDALKRQYIVYHIDVNEMHKIKSYRGSNNMTKFLPHNVLHASSCDDITDIIINKTGECYIPPLEQGCRDLGLPVASYACTPSAPPVSSLLAQQGTFASVTPRADISTGYQPQRDDACSCIIM